MYALMLVALTATLSAPEHYILESTENVWDATAEDLDQNGVQDVLLLCADERSHPLEKYLAVHLGEEGGVYQTKPSFTMPLPSNTGAYFLAEVDGAAPREFVSVNAMGAEVYRFDAATQVFSLEYEPRFLSLFPTRTREPMFIRSVTSDLDEDGKDEWLVPTPLGYAVRKATEELALIEADVHSSLTELGNLSIQHRLPDFMPFQPPGETGKGLAFLSDEYADFAYGDNWSERWRFDIPLNVEDKWDASTSMKDVNKDGFPDLLITQTRGTMSIESITQIYVADKAFSYPEKPTTQIESKGAVEAPVFRDVDGDGDEDAVVISVPFGVKNIINFFVRGKVSVSALLYEFKDGSFGDKPAYKTNLTLGAPDGRDRISYAMDDFTGDGRIDLAFSKSADAMVIHHGAAEDFLESSAAHTIEMPSFGVAHAHDLQGDGSKDIVLYHPGAVAHGKRVEVLVF